MINENMKNIDTLEYHKKNPNITVQKYVRAKLIELAHEIQSVQKVYLDTNYWVLLRDARLGRATDDKVIKLLRILEELVYKGLIICPISNDTFSEIFTQTDTNTLRANTQIIDDLSKGIVLLSSQERIGFEVIYFFRSNTNASDQVYTPDEMVWTKMCYVFGFSTPVSKSIPSDLDCAIQKAFIDQMWDLTMTDILDIFGSDGLSRIPRFPNISQQLNDGKFAHIDECKSFKQLFLEELKGILDINIPDFKDLMVHLFESKTGQYPSAEELSSDDGGRIIAKFIYEAFRLNKLKSELPAFRILAGLHAAIRWDKERKYKPTDVLDFHHAVAAIPYFDYFLTERSLRNLVHNKNLKIDTLFRCKTISDIDEAIDELSQIAS